MAVRHRWALGLAAGLGVVGFVATSGVIVLANHFVDQLSSPHLAVDDSLFTIRLPSAAPEPDVSLQRPLFFRTADGKVLKGDFWAQPRPAPTVILCHGYRVTRELLRPVAALEYSYGYNILLFDFRGHGESEGTITSGGNAEVRDLEAAVEVAVQQPEALPGKVVIHGFSMGAAVALLMSPRPEVAAIVADSSYARLSDILQRLVRLDLQLRSSRWKAPFRVLSKVFPLVSWIIVGVSQALFWVRFRHGLLAWPMRRWRTDGRQKQSRRYPPILLIHGLTDQFIPIAHARQLEAHAMAQHLSLETYFVENATHCEAYGLDPERYINTMREFVERWL